MLCGGYFDSRQLTSYFWFPQAQKIHSLSKERDGAKTTIRTLNKRNESDIVSDCLKVNLWQLIDTIMVTIADFVFFQFQDCVNNLMESVKGLKKNLGEKDVSGLLLIPFCQHVYIHEYDLHCFVKSN